MNIFITEDTHGLFNRFFDFNNMKKISEEYVYLFNDLAVWNFLGFNDIKNSLKELDFTINDLISMIDDKKAYKSSKIKKKIEKK